LQPALASHLIKKHRMQISVSRHCVFKAHFGDRCQPEPKLAARVLRSGLKTKLGQAGPLLNAHSKRFARPRPIFCGIADGASPAQSIVRAYDFVVLGSGIAGLTYATKVGLGCGYPTQLFAWFAWFASLISTHCACSQLVLGS
jgi:hypothetical protein